MLAFVNVLVTSSRLDSLHPLGPLAFHENSLGLSQSSLAEIALDRSLSFWWKFSLAPSQATASLSCVPRGVL